MGIFIGREEAFAAFRQLRDALNASQYSYDTANDFEAMFEKVKELAADGNLIAQDVAAYYYKDGVDGYLDEDYKKYMQWELLAAAGGNAFAIEKLQFFLGYAYDLIVANEAFGRIKYKNGIDEYNYIHIIGKRICEMLVAHLQIEAKALAAEKDVNRPYLPAYFRDYRKAVDTILPSVIESLDS